MKRLITIAAILCASLALSADKVMAVATMTDYTAQPPFIATVIQPNVLIVLDNSGSMNDDAYSSDYDPTQFSSGQYYGLFDSTKYYQYTANNRWEETGTYTGQCSVTTTTGCAADGNCPGTETCVANSIPASGPGGASSATRPIASGNFLNWATMSRLTVAKKLLIGGKASPRSPSGAT
ncbi:MAG: hypothetical protein HY886_09095, partial [Deltaproteobacteria bacterium]|nr:hypothetical protein [Deltaproteobacteria bacterium]